MSSSSSGPAGALLAPKPYVMRTFYMLYTILAAVALGIFLVVVIVALVDVIGALVGEAKQKRRFLADTQMMNQDSRDIALLSYLKNDPKNEPFHVFRNQLWLNNIMNLTAVVLLVFVIQLIIFFILKFAFSGRVGFMGETLAPTQGDLVAIALIALVVFGTLALNGLYKGRFLKKAQPELRDLRTTLTNVRGRLYALMSRDATFLALLRNNNQEGMKQYMADKLRARADEEVLRMVFTLNLYLYFSEQVPQTDKNYDTVMGIFQRDNVVKQAIDIPQFLPYNRAVYLPNQYNTLREYLSPFLDKRELAFITELTTRMGGANKELSKLLQVPVPKRGVYSYLFLYAFLALVFLVLIGALLAFGVLTSDLGKDLLELIRKLRAAFRPSPVVEAIQGGVSEVGNVVVATL